MIFKKCKKCSMAFGWTSPVSNFLKSVTSRHCSNDAKEADILGRFGLPLNGAKTLGCLTLRYMEKKYTVPLNLLSSVY